jgi:hypothetical protein
MLLITNRTDPSISSTLTPPVRKLRAVTAAYLYPAAAPGGKKVNRWSAHDHR